MTEGTKIQWAHNSFNMWTGCAKVAAGCLNCYAEELMAIRYKKVIWGPNGTRVLASPSYWLDPPRWDRKAKKAGERQRVFCASLADVFEDWGTKEILTHQGNVAVAEHGGQMCMDDVRDRLFNLIDETNNLDWLILTKRPENVLKMWPDYSYHACVTGDCPHWSASECDKDTKLRENVWLLTSVSVQEDADRNVPLLLAARDLVPVLGLSVEPLTGPVQIPLLDKLDWVIVGGESGNKSRPCEVEWIRHIVQQCKAASVPVFVKQLGRVVWEPYYLDDDDRRERLLDNRHVVMQYVQHLNRFTKWDHLTFGQPHPLSQIQWTPTDRKGGDMSEWPEDLRIRQFPAAKVGAL